MTVKQASGAAQLAFLEELVRLRMEAGLTPRELAECLGIQECSVIRSEAGKRCVSVVELQRWTSACGSNLEKFGQRLNARLP